MSRHELSNQFIEVKFTRQQLPRVETLNLTLQSTKIYTLQKVILLISIISLRRSCVLSYCKVEKYYGQQVLEYNDSSIEDTAFVIKSTISCISTASQEMWHYRMKHLHLDTIKKLPDATQEVKIGERNSCPEGALCLECEKATASWQIS